ncbi:hypothetical protein T265_01936 [Opisthorchis viverrini]|uniref:Uncharacterized protein n=1 Tax=Opisthorchis viverrini TaxID=6198 RepID=A0A074ZXL9_OPIVI|nr:hypothetical protein T265_01936 [Opisthorchis viverrini]KER31846.1 hypothetical protein T265_01936 [Opisthorchis viverrini]
MRRPGAAHSVAWKHHKREVQLGSRCHSNECIFASAMQFGFKDNDNNNCSAVIPLWCLADKSPGESTRAWILPGCPSLDRGN